MSTTSNINGTTIVTGPNVLQVSDFIIKAGVLHPVAIGSIALFALFISPRLGSNRSIAPITVFDWLINVALGSTLAGIVNGASLVTGLLGSITLLEFQYITSTIASRIHERLAWIFAGPPLVIAFRGKMLTSVMAKHRISSMDVWAALRQQGVLSIRQVEVGIIEPNGTFTVFTKKTLEEAGEYPEALMAVRAYKLLCQEADGHLPGQDDGKSDDHDRAEKGVNGNAIGGIDGTKASRSQECIARDNC